MKIIQFVLFTLVIFSLLISCESSNDNDNDTFPQELTDFKNNLIDKFNSLEQKLGATVSNVEANGIDSISVNNALNDFMSNPLFIEDICFASKEGIILITGSIFVISEARKILVTKRN